MFFAMLWSNRAGLEALVGGAGRHNMALTTLGLLVVGGLILGPIVQKYAFGAYWTGWPLGEDLTDNKLAVAAAAWAIAVWRRGNTKSARTVAIIAALVVLAVYMIPHSMHGSTLDYSTMETGSG
jgi:Na+/melibiose symporter-like transporter